MPIYIYKKGTQKNLYYFYKELSSKNSDRNKKMKNNKVDKENKENIPNNELYIALVSNKVI